MIDDSPLPSDAEFNEDTAFGMRPISPGSGMEFSKALGGNRPREQFTIVIVSYNRDQVLSVSSQLRPHLNFKKAAINYIHLAAGHFGAIDWIALSKPGHCHLERH